MRSTALTLALSALALGACASDDADTDADTDLTADTDGVADTDPSGSLPLDDDAEMAALLWDRVRDWQDWQAPPRWEGVQKPAVGSGHGTFVEITANPVAVAAWNTDPMPADSIIVKRTHDLADGTAPTDRLYAMWKVPAYQPDDGGWFWAVWDDGVASTRGAPALCTGCHDTGTDLVRAAVDSPKP